ncbi:MAG TPA: P-type DNA transfer ATPase VirB11 [Steroidobacteraceae bacterium]|jgi:type IV secretion system protein VirB11
MPATATESATTAALRPPASDSGRQFGAELTALVLTLRPLGRFLRDPDITEICINRPCSVFIETRSGWRQEAVPAIDFNWCCRFAKLLANHSHQRVDTSAPLLSASLPGGERVQLVMPPATSAGCVAISIRRPTAHLWSIQELSQAGIFRSARRASGACDRVETQLVRLLAANEFEAFMRLAVRSRRNILVSGPTGSGKTTWTKALIREIPADERLITIEDAPELVLDRHPNHVRLFYSKDGQGVARVSPKQLIECCLRMKPDRILLAELRAEEAFDYLRSVNSGHPGSITSVHATSAELAFEQLVLLVKQTAPGRELSRADIKDLLYLLIDVVVQFDVQQRERYIREIWYEPSRKRCGQAA